MKKPNLIDNRKRPPVLDPTKASFITQIEEEPVKEEETNPSQTVGISFPEPLSKIETNPLPMEKITIPEPSPTISTNQINYGQEPIIKQTEDNTTNNETITPEISEPGFVTCPKCGAKVKSDAKACFLCGTKLN